MKFDRRVFHHISAVGLCSYMGIPNVMKSDVNESDNAKQSCRGHSNAYYVIRVWRWRCAPIEADAYISEGGSWQTAEIVLAL